MTAPRTLVIGASGLVGGALMRVLEAAGFDAIGTAHTRPWPSLQPLDLRQRDQVSALLNRVDPELVFLPAALTAVDVCEQEPEQAWAINVAAVELIAQDLTRRRARLVFYSTDYVFDGGDGPYDEGAVVGPLNVYGRTKLAAERVIQESGAGHLILRTTVVYGWDRASRNFAQQVWQRLSAGQGLPVANDQIGNPTLADYLAEVSLRLAQAGVDGIVNVVGRDRLSRAAFAEALARTFGLDPALVEPRPTAELGQIARRPLQGGLTGARLQSLLGTEAPRLGESLPRLRRQWRADTQQRYAPRVQPGRPEQLKQEILDRVTEYHALVHQPAPFVPFSSRINYAGRVFGAEELGRATEAVLDFWLTLGPWGDQVERELRAYLGARDVALVNSGSSANLAAVAALCSPLLERPLRPGDEVLTPAVTFPTTLAPLVQHGLIPVFVDAEIGTYNVNPDLLEAAISPRTRALFLPHALGNPFDLDRVGDLARRHELYLIEDACDALGAEWNGQRVGSFGDLATLSFFPAHQITMGEGGAVVVNRGSLGRIVRSLRDWGRDCWCGPGESNTCGKRFGWTLGELPAGYDHKYTYSQLGYNLKPTDLQAAIAAAQIERLDGFVAARQANFKTLYRGLEPYEEQLLLPRWAKAATPSWFGFPITVGAAVSRRELVGWLEDSNIETRQIYAGNILRQPGYLRIPHRVDGSLDQSDRIMRDTFFIGVYPGLTGEQIEFILARFKAFFDKRR